MVLCLWHHSRGILPHLSLRLIEVWERLFMHSSLKVPKQHLSQAEVWTCSTAALWFFFAILLWICCWAWITVLLHDPSFRCWTHVLTFISRILWLSKWKVPQLSPIHAVLIVSVRCLCSRLGAVNHGRTSPLWSCLLEGRSSRGLWVYVMQLRKPSCADIFRLLSWQTLHRSHEAFSVFPLLIIFLTVEWSTSSCLGWTYDTSQSAGQQHLLL